MKGIIEIVKSLEDSCLLLLGAILSGNILAGKGINGAGEGIIRAGYGNKKVRKTTTKNKRNF